MQPSKPQATRLGDLINDWQIDAEAAHSAFKSGLPRGPITGLRTLDKELGGYLAPGIHVFHGQPGSGKTALALQIAASCGCPALFLTCEMSAMDLLRRVTAAVTRTPIGRLMTGELSPATSLSLARQAAAACPNLSIADATTAYADRACIQEMAEGIRGNHKDVLIVVDSVHAWADGRPGVASEYEALNLALYDLLDLANRLKAPVLGVAERNRASMETGGISAGAGSRKLEYKSWTMFDLQQVKGCDADSAGEVQVTLTLPKNRSNRPDGKINLLFNGALQSFREPETFGR